MNVNMSDKEKYTAKIHMELLKLTFADITTMWRDEGVLCISYGSRWWHYNESGEWW